MIQTIIKINGKYFAGYSEEHIKLVRDKTEARLIEGQRCLKSDVDNIFYYIKNDDLQFKKIEIIKIA